MRHAAQLRHHASDTPDESELAAPRRTYALAIEPDDTKADALARMLTGRIGGELTVVRSTDAAYVAIVDTVPDVILMSPLLAPQQEEQIMAHLGALGPRASHVQVLSIPRFGEDEGEAPRRRWFGGARKSMDGADPDAFASEVSEYLSQAATARQVSAPPQIEHIEELLGRLDDVFDSVPSELPEGDPPAPAGDRVPEATPDNQGMAMTPAHELNIEPVTHDHADARMPRFLLPDERVPVPLRALLDEAEGCLKMSFLTGAGACASRTLDLLLAEQGLGGGDRGEQVQQLAKKHPAVADTFLRGLSVVTNNPSGSWDETRVRLAIAILKAIAYEIYVLGPERKERAAYVIDLLERFKAANR